MATVVVLDTSALMLPVEVGIRVFDELERLFGAVDPVVASAAIDELDRLATGGGRPGRAASVGRELVADRCRSADVAAKTADDAAVSLARSIDGAYLATADRALADRAVAAGVPVVVPREHHELSIRRP